MNIYYRSVYYNYFHFFINMKMNTVFIDHVMSLLNNEIMDLSNNKIKNI